MNVLINFTKMHGSGNDFVVLDMIAQDIKLEKKLIKKIADRNFGIGCDQVIVVEPPESPDSDFFYRVFNADGQEVNQCGNGARCFGQYVYQKGYINKKQINISTNDGQYTINIESGNQVTVDMGAPNFNPTQIPISIKQNKSPAFYQVEISSSTRDVVALSLGNPHCVISVADLSQASVRDTVKFIQQEKIFPKGVNVGFSQVLARNHIKLRIFERGVGETLACGSAACAAVIAGILNNELNNTVRVDMPGGPVSVHWPGKDASVKLTGTATFVFKGTFCYFDQSHDLQDVN